MPVYRDADKEGNWHTHPRCWMCGNFVAVTDRPLFPSKTRTELLANLNSLYFDTECIRQLCGVVFTVLPVTQAQDYIAKFAARFRHGYIKLPSDYTDPEVFVVATLNLRPRIITPRFPMTPARLVLEPTLDLASSASDQLLDAAYETTLRVVFDTEGVSGVVKYGTDRIGICLLPNAIENKQKQKDLLLMLPVDMRKFIFFVGVNSLEWNVV